MKMDGKVILFISNNLVKFLLKSRNLSAFMRTSNKKVMIFPNEELALTVLAEWETQSHFIRTNFLPVTTLFSKVTDLKDNPFAVEDLKDEILNCFEIEPICHRECVPIEIDQTYSQYWDPIIEWYEEKFNTKLNVFTYEIKELQSEQKEAREAFRETLEALSTAEVVALRELIRTADSPLIGIAFFYNQINTKQAVDATLAHKILQVKSDGFVYGDHDFDFSDRSYNFASLRIFLDLMKK